MIRWWICVNNQQFAKTALAPEEFGRSLRMRSVIKIFSNKDCDLEYDLIMMIDKSIKVSIS